MILLAILSAGFLASAALMAWFVIQAVRTPRDQFADVGLALVLGRNRELILRRYIPDQRSLRNMN